MQPFMLTWIEHGIRKVRATMSIRPVRRILESKLTMEGAGVKLRRAFGFGDTSEFDPFLLFDDFRNDHPGDYRAGFPWHRTGASRPSLTCWRGRWTTATAWGTRESSAPATCSG
jgi:hypothetical protein